MQIVKKIVLIVYLLGISKCYTQDTSYFVTWYSADNNHLPQNTVKSIVKDMYGFIWLSTESGLVRFDGENFKIYDSSTIPGIKSDRMYMFGGNVKKDSLVIRNELHQYFLIRKRMVVKDNSTYNFLRKTKKDYIKDNLQIIPSLHHAMPREIFTVSSGGNRYVIDNDSIRLFTDNNKLKKQFAYTVKDSSQFFTLSGKLYLIENDNGYIEFTGSKTVHKKFDSHITGKYSIYTNEPVEQVFLVSGKNVYLIEVKNDKLTTTLLYDNFDAKNNIKAIYFDAKNNALYLGSHNKGLMVVKKQDFKQMTSPLKHKRGLDGVYYGITDYHKNKILSSSGDIFENGKHTGNVDIGNGSDKYAIVTDNNGDIWVKMYIYLYRYKKESGYKNYDTWTLGNRIATLTKAKDGKIWIGTAYPYEGEEPGALYVADPDAPNCSPKLYMEFSNGPKCIYSMTEDELWVGSRGTLLKINIKKKEVTEIPEFKNAYIRNMYSTSIHELWIATYKKGLFLYKNGKIVNFPTDKNNYILTAHCIIEDKKGFFWVTTNRGLFCINKQDLYDYASGKKDGIYYYHYNKDNGFTTNEFNGGCEPCGVYLNNQTVYFPSMEGIVYFDPDNIILNHPDNTIFIDEAQVDGTTYSTDNLMLNRNFERINFFISSPYYGNKDNQYIEVKLIGPVTQDWTGITENYVSFSTLPPGKYQLKARKLSGFQSEYLYKNISFSIQPAFWQTTWFTVIVVIASVLAVILFFKIRLGYIRYKNRLLEQQIAVRTTQLSTTIKTLRETKETLSRQNENHKKLIKNITHDIKSPLKYMAITGRYVYNNLSDSDSAIKEDVESIYTSSSQLYHFVDNFLEYTKTADNNTNAEPYHLHKLVREKITFFKNIAKSHNTVVINTIDETITVTPNRHLLAIVLHNLLDNALKNTTGGTITFAVTKTENTVALSIKDTGKGMSAVQLDHYNKLISGNGDDKEKSGMGLLIIAELIVIMGITMKIKSVKGKGTEVILTITS
ncbi:HAMP domain-containing histidine kinase [Flavobacterium salilacus subsp. salilacus]|uniref:sensor histidine kinase n=1 Tax=Flavobacterium TaxID=237 RepID=UPI001074AEC4|nr:MULTISPECIES: HAMP domain-containing sensor histidine kinase [Flavobacterium]KAF2515451.1 HAMP domain-containing histidine kinase [Flavobacterium salilacus subsp. salilacus]MBE1615848.1 HAMP domain-containing histidine kinase [Flavobacterium sp. SaA2.13]